MNRLQGESTLSDDEKRTEVKRLLEMLQDHLKELAPNERQFVEDMTERKDKWPFSFSVSNRQLFWLRDIVGNI